MQNIFVSQNAPGAYRTLSEAILAVSDSRTEPAVITVAPGIYQEKIFIRKENLRIIGSGPENTVFCFGDGAKKPREDGSGEYGTFNTAVMLLAGKDITVENISVVNTAGPGCLAGQALAVYVASDRTSFLNCHFEGYQDTVFVGDLNDDSMKRLILPEHIRRSSVPAQHPVIRNYFLNCVISGDVDFIFGPNTAYFDRCKIVSRKRKSENRSFITAASTPAEQEFGLVFRRCHLTGDETNGQKASADCSDVKESVYLGRPWRDYAKTAFLRCQMEAHICPAGWHNWDRVKAEVTSSYVEYQNEGPGADPAKRASFSKQLNNPALDEYYSVQNVFRTPDEWIPPHFTQSPYR